MLPQLLDIADEHFLLNFAREIEKRADFKNVKSVVIHKLLQAAISKADLLYDDSHWCMGRGAVEPEDPCRKTKLYMSACRDLGCDDLLGNVIDRLLELKTYPEQEVYECVERTLIPLVIYFFEKLKARDDNTVIPRFRELRIMTVEFYLGFIEDIQSCTHELATLMRISAIDGDPTTFITM